MVLSIDIVPETETRLRQQAQAAGKDVRDFVSRLLDQAAAKPSLDEVLSSLRQQFAQNGVSDEQLIADITEAQADYRAQKQAQTNGPKQKNTA